MFYRLIEEKLNQWLGDKTCSVRGLLDYITDRGYMRDAQVEAIKTYLFLKIVGKNKPLWQLFYEGFFNCDNLDDLAVRTSVRELFASTPAALALYSYSRLTDKGGKRLSPGLEKLILENGHALDYRKIFTDIFYGVEYADYLFSLPMGAGKTYLMAAFIYLDLYFALQEPNNPVFAHNFLVLAPSGLKSSIVPSLRNIKGFDPSWVIPKPASDQLRKLVRFEILDEQKTKSKSTIIKNPNARKLAQYQPYEDLFGLIAITNAEKVILNGLNEDESDSEGNVLLYVKQANELRDQISKIPHLALYIDEVHHAADADIKLRQVVNQWNKGTCTGVLGFSGTPYLEKAEKVAIDDTFEIKNTDLANVVFHYPLIQGLGNFLKVPNVSYADLDTEGIVCNGVTDFLSKYADTVYEDGTTAKLAIYCGKIETLEEVVYPLVARLVAERGMGTECILKHHQGNRAYKQPEGSEAAFSSLDSPLSPHRIVLLVQIGKEGWDCHSLTGVILPHKGACPTNMVLQTSCRCLRQVQKGARESALIWLNPFNAEKLNQRLIQLQNITLQEFSQGGSNGKKQIERFSRMDVCHVPPIDFYQFHVRFDELIIDDRPAAQRLEGQDLLIKTKRETVVHQDFSGAVDGYSDALEEADSSPVTFHAWLALIAKESFGHLSTDALFRLKDFLHPLFENITVETSLGYRVLSPAYDQVRIRSLIRLAFIPKRELVLKEEEIPQSAELLEISNLKSPIWAESTALYHPNQNMVKEIVEADKNRWLTPEEIEKAKSILEEHFKSLGISPTMPTFNPYPERRYTYHYLPYHFDSGLELSYFQSILPMLKDKGVEFYFNGDDNLTAFKIECYARTGKTWRSLGRYVPDFIMLSRDETGSIYKVAIVETKGLGFAANFAERRRFMEQEFVPRNNSQFGYNRFTFLYLEDTLSQEARRDKTLTLLQDFF